MGLVEGKVVIVTGGGRGIGRAAALAFAREGAKVVVDDTGVDRDGSGGSDEPARSVVREIEALGGEAVASTSSVDTEQGAGELVDLAVERFGRVDVLVCCAGILLDQTLLRTDLASFRAMLDVHLVGTLLCTQRVAKQMIAQGDGGRIIHTTSASGMIGNQGQVGYSSAMAGVVGLTRTAAIELQRHRILVNAIAPIAKTRLTEDLPMFESLDSLTPEHVAPVALFLGCSLAGQRTGHVLAVSGAQVYAFKVVQTAGRFKEGHEPWTAAEIAEHWDGIVKA
jgi:NAD(P)-dependent dehydrogenase (short-subunit alcohol dehydrogenase family)